MTCCPKKSIAKVMAKCSDRCHVIYPDGTESLGDVPSEINIGGYDYLEFAYCMNCGKITGDFPIEIPKEEGDD